jgi:hypothetical protein
MGSDWPGSKFLKTQVEHVALLIAEQEIALLNAGWEALSVPLTDHDFRWSVLYFCFRSAHSFELEAAARH